MIYIIKNVLHVSPVTVLEKTSVLSILLHTSHLLLLHFVETTFRSNR